MQYSTIMFHGSYFGHNGVTQTWYKMEILWSRNNLVAIYFGYL